MGDMFLSQEAAMLPTHLHTWDTVFGSGMARLIGATNHVPASAAWPASNRAIYYPFGLDCHYQVERFFWGNGSSVGGSIDVGVYGWDMNLIAKTGTTTTAGASAIQYAAPSVGDVILPPGGYYLAQVNSGTTNAVAGSAITANTMRMIGCLQEALGSTSLPNTMTPAAVASAMYTLVGITKTASNF